MSEVRYALIGTRRGADYVGQYLPANYRIVGEATDQVLIAGRDNAGWTLDGYVLPRLGSGLIGGREITAAEYRSLVGAPTEADLAAGWESAWHIASNGASNPKGVEHALRNLVRDKHIPIDHPIVRAIEGHLDYLHGNGLGPELDDLRAVDDNARRLGILDEHGQYVPAGERHQEPRVVCGDCGDDLVPNPDKGPGREVTVEHAPGNIGPAVVYDSPQYLHADDRTPQCMGRADATKRHPHRFAPGSQPEGTACEHCGCTS